MFAINGVGGSKGKKKTRERALANSVRVSPASVLFTQDTGFASFSDGRWVAQTIREIVTGTLAPQDLPLLRVVKAPETGELYSLDNRRLFCFKSCRVGMIDMEIVENDDGANEEYWCKRFGNENGTTSNGTELKIKPEDGSKRSLAAAAALMPCPECEITAVDRLRSARFEKGAKYATLPSGCEQCAALVKWIKKEKPAGARPSKKPAGGADELAWLNA
jgi:hypothetical protein